MVVRKPTPIRNPTLVRNPTVVRNPVAARSSALSHGPDRVSSRGLLLLGAHLELRPPAKATLVLRSTPLLRRMRSALVLPTGERLPEKAILPIKGEQQLARQGKINNGASWLN